MDFTSDELDPRGRFEVPLKRWDSEIAKSLDAPGLLRYRSRLLGSDLSITNFGGGNTSAKIATADPLTGETVEVLWVKGSGGDIGSIELDGFATLYLDKLHQMERRFLRSADEDEMAGLLPLCVFGGNPRAPSIDTPLHALLPFAHVDHMHPDSITALACSDRGKALVMELFGDTVGWLDWRRPGFQLALQLRAAVEKAPGLRGVVLGGHGLVSWGETAQECYENTVDLIRRAADFLNEKLKDVRPFGEAVVQPHEASARRAFATRAMPVLRGLLGDRQRKAGHFADAPGVLEFVSGARVRELAALGTSCPDHFLRTKVKALVLDPAAMDDREKLIAEIAAYRADYTAYYARCKRADSPALRDPNPVVILIPGIGMFTFAHDRTTARLAAEFFQNAINVMRGACATGQYIGLDEKEAFGIEYWVLEEAKLRRLPPPRPLHGAIAYVSGGAGGIGRAVANRLLSEGACVTIADFDRDALQKAEAALVEDYGRDRVFAVCCDVRSQDSVQASFEDAALRFGGLDIAVANAGIASSAPIHETSLDMWRVNYSVLVEGYFLVAQKAFSLFREQKRGGNVIFVGSKNALATPMNASAYASAKAAELHLARCLALEGGPDGIRVNVVNPDAVIRGSRIWSGTWRRERAEAHGVKEDELEEVYRKRSLLKAAVLPEDVAEAILFLASDKSAKSTGNIINVDAGNAQAFTR
ncbi:MAG: bifunctional rhamnulose-1-phosphate aldolase/short-chain dehydrogenase [Alphaproteobacteria bacterium]|jgi:rhamnulose-1-phosphate aldolase/alcohol dehydrogenase|nr:bifunctional rhamnulose-1-phosphate aldolase/short-chain dehydrogenase [Alphaproteobacteria bacterium]